MAENTREATEREGQRPSRLISRSLKKIDTGDLRHNPYESIHSAGEVWHDSTDDQIFARILELDHFYTIENVREERSGIWSSINSPVGIVNQGRQLRRTGKAPNLVSEADIAGLLPVVINNDLVQSRNDEVDGAACFDFCDLR